MGKIKKPSVKTFDKAMSDLDSRKNSEFGSFDFDLKTLPCVQKPPKEKVTAMFDPEVVKAVREASKSYGVSKSALMNDILKKVLIEG